MASDDRDALAIIRESVRNLGDAPPALYARGPDEPAVGSLEEILGVLPAAGQHYDPLELIARLVDAADFEPFKPLYGPELVCGVARLRGWKAAFVASSGPLTSPAALKAAHFVAMAAGRGLPVVFLVHLDGSVPSDHAEAGTLLKDTAKLMREVACAGVPLITVVVGDAIGPAASALGGRAMDPRFYFLLPTARVHAVPREHVPESERERWDAEASAYASSGRIGDDGVIDPRHLRDTLARALEICVRAVRAGGHAGPIRM